jgi:hypothetical protein
MCYTRARRGLSAQFKIFQINNCDKPQESVAARACAGQHMEGTRDGHSGHDFNGSFRGLSIRMAPETDAHRRHPGAEAAPLAWDGFGIC